MAQLVAWRDSFLGEDPAFRRFVLLIALVTAVPMLTIPVVKTVHRDTTAMLSILGLLTFLGGPGHVASTTWFYADPVARRHFWANPIRYIVAPLFLIVGTTAAYAVWQDQEPTRWINLIFAVWLLWHYQRQNWGILSFVARVTSGGSATKLEEAILKIAVVGGIVGGIKSAGFGAGTAVEAYGPQAFQLGLAITALVPVLIGAAVATNPALRASPLRLCTLVGTAAFFLPVFVLGNPESAVLTYGLAHGLQYLVFMSYVAGTAAAGEGAAPGAGRPGVVALLASVIGVGVFLTVCGDVQLVKEWNLLPLFGLVLGITMAHFVVDAGVWRLRDEFPRRYIGPAFSFLPAKPR